MSDQLNRKRPGRVQLEGEDRYLHRCDARVIVPMPLALRERLEAKAHPLTKAEYVRALIERDLLADASAA